MILRKSLVIFLLLLVVGLRLLQYVMALGGYVQCLRDTMERGFEEIQRQIDDIEDANGDADEQYEEENNVNTQVDVQAADGQYEGEDNADAQADDGQYEGGYDDNYDDGGAGEDAN